MIDRQSSQRVVVVVPTRNSARTLRDCLASIRAQTLPSTLVVVDNASRDATVAIATELADLVLVAGPERSAQRNAGAVAVASSIVGFVDSDMILSATVLEEVVAAIDDGATSVVVPETTVGEGFWARVSEYERSFYEGSATIEAPRFLTSVVFQEIGGFDEAMTGAEDWDLGVRSAGAGPRVWINARITHEEGRVRYFELCRKKAYYAPGVARFVRKHGAGSLVAISRRPWLRQPRSLLNPLGVGLVVLKAGQGAAMGLSLAMSLVGRRVALPGPRDERH